MRQSLTLCPGVPYDIVQTNKKGECNICVALDFADVDGIVVIVDVVVAVAVTADVAVTIVAVDAVAAITAAGAAVAVAAEAITAAAVVDAAATAAAAAMISVQAPDARHTGKASAMAIGKASTMQPGAIDVAALPPVQPEDLDQLSPKAAVAAIANIN